MNKNIYRQADSRWASLPYPKGSTFGGCGCGCCACLHVMIELDKYKNWTPKDLRPYMVNQGFAIRNQGTLWAGITKTLQHYGFSVINHPNMKSVWETLKDRKYKFGVILFRGGSRGGVTWTTGGHYVAFVDYKVQNGKHYFYCKDSGGRHHDGWYCYETTMAGLIPQIWTANPPAGSIGGGDIPVPSVDPTPTPGKLTVDGKFGPASIKALQKKMGTTQDGKISGQNKSLKKYHSGFSSGISYGSGGSNCIKALQKMLRLSGPDGQLGPNTIKAFQKYLSLSNPDGYWGPNTSKAVQKWLNGDLKPATNSSSSSSANKTPSTPAATPTKSVYKVIDVSVWQGDKVNELLENQAPVEKVGYSGILPTTTVRKSNAQVIADTIKWAKWIAGDNRFHYGYTNKAKDANAHHNGCYFCGTNGKQKRNMLDPKFTYCCNPFVGAAWAHGGCVPKALSLCRNTSSWDFGKNSGYAKSSLFTNLGHPAKSSLKPGDVLCKDTHVALYIGNGKIVEAGSGDDNIRNSTKWNNSIRVTTLTDARYKGFLRVHRYNSSVNAVITMYYGEVGSRVELWQKYLNWYFGKTVVTVDGIYGDTTLKYTKQFQEKEVGKGQGDGWVGPRTLAAAAIVKK